MSTKIGDLPANVNRQVAAEWVAALRSGRYLQTTGTLTTLTPDGAKAHCCLGVLSELAADKSLVVRYQEDDRPVIRYEYARGEGETMPPKAVEQWIGIGGNDFAWPVLIPEGHKLTTAVYDSELDESTIPFEPGDVVGLADANDTYRLTFDEIADLIEYTYVINGS